MKGTQPKKTLNTRFSIVFFPVVFRQQPNMKRFTKEKGEILYRYRTDQGMVGFSILGEAMTQRLRVAILTSMFRQVGGGQGLGVDKGAKKLYRV